jgi:hypothetical protein
MFEEISEKSLCEMFSKFTKNGEKLHNDIQKTFAKDDTVERKSIEKQLKVNNAILSNILKLRNLIAINDP